MRLAANYAIDRQALSDAETLGASRPAGNHVPRTFEFALPLDPYPYDPVKAKQLLAEAGYPRRHPHPHAADGARRLLRADRPKKARGVCVCTSALYGNAASRISQVIPSDGAYGGYPDIDALYKQQAGETDRKTREALLRPR